MDSEGFLGEVLDKLEPIAPFMLPGIVRKQLADVGATRDSLTPAQAEEFCKKMELALKNFLGPDGSQRVHQLMLKELRKYAPEYFEQTRGI